MSSQWFGQHGAEPANANQVPVVTSILKDFSAEALGELRTWLEQNPPAVTIQSIVGFTQFTANAAPVKTGTSTVVSSSYGDCADGAGPTVTGLPDGKYVVLYGASAVSSLSTAAGGACIISPKFNSTEANDVDLAVMSGLDESTLFGFTTTTLAAGNNTVTLRYRTGATASTATFRYRRLMVLKYANS